MDVPEGAVQRLGVHSAEGRRLQQVPRLRTRQFRYINGGQRKIWIDNQEFPLRTIYEHNQLHLNLAATSQSNVPGPAGSARQQHGPPERHSQPRRSSPALKGWGQPWLRQLYRNGYKSAGAYGISECTNVTVHVHLRMKIVRISSLISASKACRTELSTYTSSSYSTCSLSFTVQSARLAAT
jgi:hypothetical protein